MPKITLPQKNLSFESAEGTNLMTFLLNQGLPVASSCKGEGICSKCVVKISPFSEPQAFEQQTLERNKISNGSRLSCQIKISTDLIVETTYW